MMKKTCAFFMCLICCTAVLAQLKIAGYVTNTSNEPLPQATISVVGKKPYQVVADHEGRWQLAGLVPGQYIITTSYQGYMAASDTLQLTAHQQLQTQLAPQPAWLQPVEVKALRAGEKAPFAKTNLNKAFIEKNNLGQDIPFLLNQTPNVVVNSDAGTGIGYTGIRIRGTDATRINMTINGIPYNDAESQGSFFVNLPDFLSSVSSVQIQRGVGTSSNGAGAFGATMNFSTHDYRPDAYLDLNNSIGSFSTFKNTLRFGSGLLGNQFTIDGRLSQISSQGYIDRASSLLQAGYLSLGWWQQKSSLKFNAIIGKEKTYQAWYGVAEADLKNNRKVNYAGMERPGEPYDNETDNYWQNHYQLIYNTQLPRNTQFTHTLYLTTGKGYYEQYKADVARENYGLPGNGNTDLVRQLWLQNKLFGQLFTWQRKGNKQELTLGGGWSHYPGQHFGRVVWTPENPNIQQRWYYHEARKTDANLYGKWQYALTEKLQLFADVQYRFVTYKTDGFRNNPAVTVNKTWHFVNPKAGLHYQNGLWSGFASYAMGNKEPNRDDFEAGLAQQPSREQLHDLELNLSRRQLLPGLDVGTTAYLMYYRDQLVLTGQVNDVGAYTRTNIPHSYRAGVELEATYRQKAWSLQYNLALSTNRLIDFTEFVDDYDQGGQQATFLGNTPIALSPGTVQFATLGYKIANVVELEWMLKQVGRQFLDNTGNAERMLKGYLVNDIRASYNFSIGKWLKQGRWVVLVNNLFNVMYQPNGYTFSYIAGGRLNTENYYYPMAGTNLLAALQLSF